MGKYGLLVAIVSVIIIPIIFFGIIGNNDGKFFLPMLNNPNQKESTRQIEDDTFLRGAVDVNSEGKQISEKNMRHLCGSSLLPKSTEFIQEYQIPFVCAQPVGITIAAKTKYG
jgi:hypothetical protein